jgi:hypothetical protein
MDITRKRTEQYVISKWGEYGIVLQTVDEWQNLVLQIRPASIGCFWGSVDRLQRRIGSDLACGIPVS